MTKKICATILSVSLLATGMPVNVLAAEQTQTAQASMTHMEKGGSDIAGHRHEKLLKSWIASGELKGDQEGNINPEKPITRAEFAALINRAEKFNKKTDITRFKDVKPDDWYYEDVARAVSAGYLVGFDPNTFAPTETLTAEQAIAVASRLSKLNQQTVKSNVTVDAVSDWAKTSVERSLIDGVVATTDLPKNLKVPCSRTEAILWLDRAIHKNPVFSIPGTYKLGDVNDVTVTTDGVSLEGGHIKGQLTLAVEGNSAGKSSSTQPTLSLKNVKLDKAVAADKNSRILIDGKPVRKEEKIQDKEKPQGSRSSSRSSGSSHSGSSSTKPGSKPAPEPTPPQEEQEKADKQALQASLAKAKAWLDANNTTSNGITVKYDEALLAPFKASYDQAKGIQEKADAKKNEVDQAQSSLAAAMDKFVSAHRAQLPELSEQMQKLYDQMPEDENNAELTRHRETLEGKIKQLKKYANNKSFSPAQLYGMHATALKDYQAAKDYLKRMALQEKKEADEYDSLPRALDWAVNMPLTASIIEAQFDDLPDGAHVVTPETVTFDASGDKNVQVTIKFSDGSTKVVPLLVSVKAKANDFSTVRIRPIKELKALDAGKVYTDGTYQGIGRGYLKNIYVTVTVEGGKIKAIEKTEKDAKIDDGGKFERIGFHRIINTLKDKQDPQSLAAQLNTKLDLVQGMYDMAAKEQHSDAAYAKAMEHFFGSAAGAPSGLANMLPVNILDILGNTVTRKLKAANYDRIPGTPDVHTGATWTARGTANAVVNALQKARPDNNVLEMKVRGSHVEYNKLTKADGITGYVRGEKFLYKDYEVVLTKRGNKQEIIQGKDFAAKGIKVINQTTGAVIPDGMVLNEETIGGRLSNGLKVEFIHQASGSRYPMSMSGIALSERLKLQSIEYRLKEGTTDGKIFFTPPDAQWDEFIVYVKMKKEEFAEIAGKKIEVRVNYVDKNGKTYHVDVLGDRAVMVPTNPTERVELQVKGLPLETDQEDGRAVSIPYDLYRLDFSKSIDSGSGSVEPLPNPGPGSEPQPTPQEKADKQALQASLAKAKAWLDANNTTSNGITVKYDEALLAPFKASYEQAKGINDNEIAKQSEVTEAQKNLDKAMVSFRSANQQKLSDLAIKMETLNKSIPESDSDPELIGHKDKVSGHITLLKKYAKNRVMSPAQLYFFYARAEKDYEAAVAYLKTLAPAEKADKQALQASLAKAKAWLDANNTTSNGITVKYDEALLAPFKASYEQAKGINDNEIAKQSEVTEAQKNLDKAMVSFRSANQQKLSDLAIKMETLNKSIPESDSDSELIGHKDKVGGHITLLKKYAKNKVMSPAQLYFFYARAEKDYQAAVAYLKTLAPAEKADKQVLEASLAKAKAWLDANNTKIGGDDIKYDADLLAPFETAYNVAKSVNDEANIGKYEVEQAKNTLDEAMDTFAAGYRMKALELADKIQKLHDQIPVKIAGDQGDMFKESLSGRKGLLERQGQNLKTPPSYLCRYIVQAERVYSEAEAYLKSLAPEERG
ncbi:S-layer homology domain-containing protein [Peptococcus niger]|nr:S-layer homology domain-containing protein [Peptococcus niger]